MSFGRRQNQKGNRRELFKGAARHQATQRLLKLIRRGLLADSQGLEDDYINGALGSFIKPDSH